MPHCSTTLFRSILVFMIMLIAISGCSSETGQKNVQVQQMPVRSIVARQGDMPEILTAVGRVEASASVTIKARVSGQLLTSYFKEGQYVKKGAKLFSIDPRPFESALAAAKAELERNTVLADKAYEDLKRYQALIGQSVVSKEQYDQIKSVLESLQATIKANKASVESARIQLEYCTVYAPISGKIGRLAVDVGNIVKAEDMALVTIEQMKPIRVTFTLPERELSRVLRRMSETDLAVNAYIEGFDSDPEKGTLLFLDNAVDRNTGTILLVAEFPNTDLHLFPGQFVDVALYIDSHNDVVIVPKTAVQVSAQGFFVFVINQDNRVSMRPVTTGVSSFDSIALAKGVTAGERIVIEGHLRLVDGTEVVEQIEETVNPK